MNTTLALAIAGLAAGSSVATVVGMDHVDLGDLGKLGMDSFDTQRCHDLRRGHQGAEAALELCVANKGQFDPGATVRARLRNEGASVLEGDLVVKVYDQRTKEAVRHLAERPLRLEAGASVELAWDQRDDAGELVDEGAYKLKAAFAGQRLGVEVCVGEKAR